jgi:hypothetical protein
VVQTNNPSTRESKAGGFVLKASLGYIERTCLKNKNKNQRKQSQMRSHTKGPWAEKEPPLPTITTKPWVCQIFVTVTNTQAEH